MMRHARRAWTGAPRGWRIAWALAVTQTVGFGVLFYAYAVFTLPMEAELGWTRAQTSGAFSLALLVSGLAALPVGRLVDARGARGLMSVASLAGALLLLAWSFVTSAWTLYLIQAAIGLVMACVLYDVAFTVIATWFRQQRIRAMLLVTTFAGLASTIFVPLATALVEGLGWRAALRVLALLLAGITVPLHALVVRRAPTARDGEAFEGAATNDAWGTAPEPSVGTREALRSGTFWWLSGAFGLDRIAIVAVAAHAVPLLLERGYAPGVVATAAGSIGLLQVVGRIAFAPATAHLPLAHLTSITFSVRAAALLCLWLVPGGVGLWAFVTGFGLANGASTLARAGLVAARFGPAHYGAINGGISTVVAVAQTVAPLGVGALRDGTGGYELALAALVTASLAAAALVLRAGTSIAVGAATQR